MGVDLNQLAKDLYLTDADPSDGRPPDEWGGLTENGKAAWRRRDERLAARYDIAPKPETESGPEAVARAARRGFYGK